MKNRQSFGAVLGLLALCLLMALPTQAQQRSNTTGLFLNAHLNGTAISYDNDNLFEEGSHSGGGGGIQIGYGFTPLITIYLGLNGSSMSTDDIEDAYTLAHVDLGSQFNFMSGRSAAVPYGNIAFTFRQATLDFGNNAEVDFNGGGITLGGGLKYFLSEKIALDVSLLGTFGKFTEIDFGGAAFDIDEVDATSVRLGLGLSFFPLPRR